jgi:Ca-activated chloride channel family protein
MSSFAFERPLWLVLIILVVICALKCRAKESAIIFPHINILKKAADKKSFLPEFLKYLSLFGLIISLAGPVKIDSSIEIKKRGYDIVLAIDASGSMRESGFDINDLALSKFDVVRGLVKDFIKKRENDNIALIVFGSFTYIASPLTFNKDVIIKLLDFLDIGIAGQKTALNNALFQSVSMLKESKAKSKIVILLTDGMDTASKIPIDVAIKMAKKYGIKIYTIGIGRKRDIDEPYLRWIAKSTQGEYFYAKEASMLKEVYTKIDKLEKSKIRGESFIKKDELYQYPLFIAVLALLGFIYIYSKRGF